MAAPASQFAPILAVIEQTPIILEKILLAATEDCLTWKPAPDRWSISEVLGHLAHVELNYRERIRAMTEKDSPSLEAYDQGACYAAGLYSGKPGREQLKRFCHERDQSLSWLRYLPDGILSRDGRHSAVGPITVADLMNEWAFHDLGHIRQTAELYRAHAFYPGMGGFQSYYTVKP